MTYPRVLLTLLLTAMTLGAAETLPPEIIKLSTAAEQGDQHAQISLGMHYRKGTGGVQKDYKEALKWYRKCADQGNARGMDNAGFMYLQGWGVAEDYDTAVAYFKAAAAKNHDQSIFNLGNCYFSGQGVEQDYALAIDSWKRAAMLGHQNAAWRLAMLHAAGEGLPRDLEKAQELCEAIAKEKHIKGMLLLGHLYAKQGKEKTARTWWTKAAKLGDPQASALLNLATWCHQDPVAGRRVYIDVDHFYQGWNNCGSTSVAMLARYYGSKTTPYAIKRLCPRSPIGTGTDWMDLVATGKALKQQWKLLTFPNDDAGFTKGVEVIRRHLDANQPVVIDFTVIRDRNGIEERFGHTLLVVGYNADLDQFVLKNPNQPSPGIQLISENELKSSWVSRGYSRISNGKPARPLIVKEQ